MSTILPGVTARAVATFGLILLAGCGGPPEGRVAAYPVQGKVTFKGRPLAGALVTFRPAKGTASGDLPGATGRTDEEGVFRLSTYGADDGAPAGDFLVSVSAAPASRIESGLLETKAKPRPDPLNGRYSNHERSGLKAHVKPGENEPLIFDLK
jgi:hypothetical protein